MKNYFISVLLFNLFIFETNAIAKPVEMPDSFPLPMTFKAFDNVQPDTKEFKNRLNENSPYRFIHSPGPDNKAKSVRDSLPDKFITLQDAYGGINQGKFSKIWPGHLLYKAGTLLAQDISPEDQSIRVDDVSRVVKSKQQLKKANQNFFYALTIYALNDKGEPDWSQAEHVILKDMNKGNLIIQRGQWDSKPLAFKAGKAVVAAHMMFWTKQWQVNLSLHSPRGGKDNLTGAEWFAREAAQRFPLSKADGIEFDVGRWTWGNPENNPMDINNDLIADYGYIDGVNSFGLGGQVFFRELRRLIGDSKTIQVDSNNAIYGMRGWKYINGVQLESFPAGNHFDRFSEAFLQLRSWTENAEALPRLSYPFTKVPTTVFSNVYLPNGAKTDFRFRVGLASACLVGMPHPFAGLNDENFDPANPTASKKNSKTPKQEFAVFNWDEYHGGDLNDWHWLGKPVNPAQQDFTDLDKTDLFSKTQWQWITDKSFVAESHQEPDGFSTNVKSIPQGVLPHTLIFGVHLEPKAANLPRLIVGREYTLEFEARGSDFWHYAGQDFERVPRMIAIKGAMTSKEGKADRPLSVLVDAAWKKYHLSFISNGSAPVFGVSEQIGATEIRNINLHAGGVERWSREFEKGLVLLNMTSDSWSVVLPDGKYKRLKGTQAPEINTGEVIDNLVTIPPRDALFLKKKSKE